MLLGILVGFVAGAAATWFAKDNIEIKVLELTRRFKK